MSRANTNDERNTHGQRFGRDPSQWDQLSVRVRPIFMLIFDESDGTIGQLDGEVSVEETIARGHVAMNEIRMRQVLKSTGQLIREVDVRSGDRERHRDTDRNGK
jgi:hypothetical protein